MDYPAFLCMCGAAAPFVAIAKDVIQNRRPWLTRCLVITACLLAISISLLYVYTSASDALCFDYHSVLDRLWKCSGIDYSWESSCCHKVEDAVSAGCGWNYSRADFCSWFGEATAQYCQVNYCPRFDRNVSVALTPNGQPGLVQDS